MTTRLMLVSPAMNPALREARFPHTDDPAATAAGAATGPATGAGTGAGARPSTGPGGEPRTETGAGPGARSGGDALDALGLRQAEAVREHFPATAIAYVSPSPRCRRTAEALGLHAKPLPALAPCAMGRWQGRTLDEVAAAEPDALASWLSDPASAPHGGESLLELLARTAHWLDALGDGAASDGAPADGATGGSATPPSPTTPSATPPSPMTPSPSPRATDGRLIAVVEPDIIRACAVHALGAPPATFWRIDVRPLTATELSGRAGRWNLLSGRPLHSTAP
ncbi:histidine phosphatase family protein [Streptomyces sp. NPDC056937]|uniref:histidine phosphatase family protein n=1 Tax=Streptomyces sp. NPDC056937 TaxID=3345969 RepID=UPI00363A74D9